MQPVAIIITHKSEMFSSSEIVVKSTEHLKKKREKDADANGTIQGKDARKAT